MNRFGDFSVPDIFSETIIEPLFSAFIPVKLSQIGFLVYK